MSLREKNYPGFMYHAQATALGGSIEKPSAEVIPSQCSIALAPAGGEGFIQVRDFNWKQIIRFDEAAAYVAGSSEDDSDPARAGKKVFNTLSTVTIRNLNIANFLQAEYVVTRISSRHRQDDEEGEIDFTGSYVAGLRIAGVSYDAEIDCDFFRKYPTYGSLAKVDATSGGLKLKARNGAIMTSALRNFKPASNALEAVERRGSKIAIPQFGTIELGHVTVKPGQRRLTMFRVEMGCPIAGKVDAAAADGNGTPVWG